MVWTSVFGTDGYFTSPMPEFLSPQELRALAQRGPIPPDLQDKLNVLMETPLVYTIRQGGTVNSSPPSSDSGSADTATSDPTLRVASWNIERGHHLNGMIPVLQWHHPLPSSVPRPPTPPWLGPILQNPNTKESLKASEVLSWLSHADIFILNEVDMAMARTHYNNVTLSLAKSLNMNGVFAPEFIELTPFVTLPEQSTHSSSGAIPVSDDDTALESELHSESGPDTPPEADPSPHIPHYLFGESRNVDPNQYKGLHGNAILSRYPIVSSRILRLPQCYDWYHQEMDKLSTTEEIRRKATKTAFDEIILSEPRYGGRVALMAELEVPQLPQRRLTVVATHLENRTPPECRREQMEAILEAIKPIDHPVVLGGDWNTTGKDVSPTSLPREIRNRLKDPKFWGKQALNLATSYGFVIGLGVDTLAFMKNFNDPTSPNIPLLARNKEHHLFDLLQDFRFADGYAFDMRGLDDASWNEKEAYLSQSNQRAFKGFEPTFSFERPWFKGIVGRYKLDWLLTKGYTTHPRRGEERPIASPQFGRTLHSINTLPPEPLSDHDPITVDLRLTPAPPESEGFWRISPEDDN